MTKIGDDILHNCPRCYREKGLSCKLNGDGDGGLVCNYDASHRFVVENGMLKELNGRKE